MLHFFPKQLHSHKTIPALRTTASKTKVDFDMNNIAKKTIPALRTTASKTEVDFGLFYSYHVHNTLCFIGM